MLSQCIPQPTTPVRRVRNPYAKMADGKAAPQWRGAWGAGTAEWQQNPAVAQALGGQPLMLSDGGVGMR